VVSLELSASAERQSSKPSTGTEDFQGKDGKEECDRKSYPSYHLRPYVLHRYGDDDQRQDQCGGCADSSRSLEGWDSHRRAAMSRLCI
jgi:hypothetical protein